jgi:two-component system sensor histidine kinase ChvG
MVIRLRSLRLRAVLVVITVVVMPMVALWLSLLYTGRAAKRVQQAVNDSAAAISERLLQSQAESPCTVRELDELAQRYRVRVRLIARSGEVLCDHDHETRTSLRERIAGLLFGPGPAPTLRAYDDEQPPLATRPEVKRAWQIRMLSGCDVPVGEQNLRLLLICHMTMRVDGVHSGQPILVYTQKSERRMIHALLDVRALFLRVGMLTLAMGSLLGWWLGWRMVLPIEALREQVRQRDAETAFKMPISLQREDEFEDLANAFSGLLNQLAERSRINQGFMADLAHEMKNPLAAVIACAESMDKDGSLEEARARRLSRVLLDSGRRLDALVTNFLELARAQAGLPNEERTLVDVHSLIAGMLESLRGGERYSQVHFVLHGRGARVLAVAARLEAALLNILDNGASFAGEGGTVSIEIAGTPEQIEITVTDSGPGIATADLPKIFDRFFTTRANRGGTGLGLPLAHAFIMAHGGTLTASSPPGQGAIFTVRLPRADPTIYPP